MRKNNKRAENKKDPQSTIAAKILAGCLAALMAFSVIAGVLIALV